MTVLPDAVLLELTGDPVQVPGVGVSVTIADVTDHGLVVDPVPDHTVLLSPGD